MLEYQLTFAGVPFVSDSGRVIRMDHTPPMGGDPENQYPKKHQPCTDLVEELNRLIPFKYLQDFGMPNTYAGRNLWAIAREWQVGPLPSPEVKIGDWYYPTTASRWSVFRGLATSSMTKAMLAATGGTTAKTFIMKANPVAPYHTDSDQTNYTLNTQMFMLPPRPLAEHGAGFDGLYLITLVDERYWWQYNPVSIQPSPSLTWVSLIQQLATALMVTVTITDPSDNYGSGPEADSPFWCNFENAATLLDAAGYNVGTTCVRDLDGSYSMQTAPEAQALVLANRGTAFRVARTAGGDIFNSGTGLLVGDLNKSKNSVLPSQVSVTFPKYVVGNAPVPHFLNSRTKNPRPSHWYEDSYGDVYTVTVGIGSGGAFVSGLAGVSTTVHTLHNTAKALYSGEGDANPFNTSGLTALAVQQATDFYNDQVASALDEVYPGTFAWTPEGFHDIIWTYSDRARGAFTRVMKGEWNRIVREFQHPTPVVEGMRGVPGVGGPLVAQSWKDSTTAGGSTTLGGALGLSDSSVVLSTPLNSLPPQNRWQGTIDSEIILFEGCSGTVGGGTVIVGVVQRGFEGTSPTSHNNGTAVSQLFPNMTHGVNCVTFEKGQYTYPSDCTSGGITGVNVVPQTQTIQVTGGTGPTYTGRVYASTEADGTLVALENCLVQERNGQTPTTNNYYDGQFVGNVNGSPLYLINTSQGASNQTVNYTNNTFTYVNNTFNFNTTSSTWNFNVSQTFNFNANVSFNISSLDVFLIGGPGYLYITAPTEICTDFFWCCTDLTLTSSLTSDLQLESGAGKVVYDVTSSPAGNVLDGILPKAFGAPLNTGDVTAATNAAPIVLTVPGWTTQPAVGSVVVVSGVLGNTAANGTWTVQASSATTLTLSGSVGNGAFQASPGSAVQVCGPRLIVLNNTGANSFLINDASTSTSKSYSQIRLPPAFSPQVAIAPKDSITLWWDGCDTFSWCVFACTVDVDNSTTPTLSSGTGTIDTPVAVGLVVVDVGFMATLPSAGTYLVLCEVDGIYGTNSPPTGGVGGVVAKLFDATAGADVPNSRVTVTYLPVAPVAGDPAGPTNGTATIAVRYVTTGAAALHLYGQATGSPNGCTCGVASLTWVKLA